MVSVTPDIIASTSFQAPPPRAKAEPSPANDSFAALVDSNATAAANNNDRVQDRAQDRPQDTGPAPQQAAADKRPAPARRDDAAGDKAQPRNVKADKPEHNDAYDSDVAAADQAGADEAAETGSNKRTKTKAAAGKDDKSTPAEKQSSGETDATDSADTQAAADQPTAETADAVATAITVAIVATDVQAPAAPATTTTASPGAGPLAIAAAAIAASNAVTEAAGTPAVTAADADAANRAAATPAKPGVQTNAGEAIATTGQGEQADEAATAQAIGLTVPATRPATPKSAAPAKASAAASDAAAPSDESEAPAASTEAPAAGITTAAVATGTEQPAVAKPNLRNTYAETAKPESAGSQAPSAMAAQLNPAGHDAAPGQSSTQASAAQTAASFQPLMQTTATQAQSSFTVTAATQSAAVPLSGLAMEIAASVRSGKSRFEIRLDPAELGRIDVRIDVDRHGQVTSHLTVEKPETLSMLRQDAPHLQRALNDAGLSTGDSSLQFSLRDQSSQGQNGNQSNPNAQRLILTEEETVPATVAGSYGRMLGASGGVDIRV
ncbi:flagellar hook-length control protein FliK [Bradyrhizobium sp.]|uniref:flagellar hook-length control protein FliK n=1 Tax=Bradyrhizobium sp. TaxID=376 RepID=UPI001E14D3A7|nr:flagellar hook-length control protein FliK [Bradyrhizobium sp.]MBI5321160.1 flagellar hook-length control protein FliK [Bradyrhizobium sp.]